MFDHRFNGSMPWQGAFELAVGALTLNYRLGPREAGKLGLITTENYLDVFQAVCDWEKVRELLTPEPLIGAESDATPPQKKTPPPRPNISPGPPADCPIIPLLGEPSAYCGAD